MEEFTVAEDPLIGTLVGGRYRVVRKLREGGMGVVYVARHELIEKLFALKLLSKDSAMRPDLVERFLREARAVAAIAHDNVLSANDFGQTTEGAVYFATELLDGRDLCDELRVGGRLAPRRAARILVQMLRALEAAHAKGVVHRDLKPENIFLVEREGDRDFVKVLDFGLAQVEGASRLTRPGTVLGTPEYFSPEQGTGQTVDARSDLYAVGCVFYAMLTGDPPFVAQDPYQVMAAHVSVEPLPPSEQVPKGQLTAALDAFVLKALAKKPEDRFQSAAEMRVALEPLLPDLAEHAISVTGEPMKQRSRASMDGHTPLPPPVAPSEWTGAHRVKVAQAQPLIPMVAEPYRAESTPRRPPPRRVGRPQWLAAASGALAACVIGLGLWIVMRPTQATRTVAPPAVAPPAVAPPAVAPPAIAPPAPAPPSAPAPAAAPIPRAKTTGARSKPAPAKAPPKRTSKIRSTTPAGLRNPYAD